MMRIANTCKCGEKFEVNLPETPITQTVVDCQAAIIKRLREQRDELVTCLQWYVEHDSTIDDEYWLAGRLRAETAIQKAKESSDE
jgi:hypothetical protein